MNNLGHTPLHHAYNAEIAQALLDNGASTSIKDNEGNTPLKKAASRDDFRDEDVVKLLIRHSHLSTVGAKPF